MKKDAEFFKMWEHLSREVAGSNTAGKVQHSNKGWG